MVVLEGSAGNRPGGERGKHWGSVAARGRSDRRERSEVDEEGMLAEFDNTGSTIGDDLISRWQECPRCQGRRTKGGQTTEVSNPTDLKRKRRQEEREEQRRC